MGIEVRRIVVFGLVVSRLVIVVPVGSVFGLCGLDGGWI